MKTNIKKTLASIVVSFVLTGCGSSSGDNGNSVPTPEVNHQNNVQQYQETTNTSGVQNYTEQHQKVNADNRIINLSGLPSDKDNWISAAVPSTGSGFSEHSIFRGNGVSSLDIQVDLNKLSNNGLGTYSGVFTHPDLIVDDETGKNELNYLFTNQPYSSYGILTNNVNQELKRLGNTFESFGFVRENPDDPKDWLKGTANYRGGIIANIEYTREQLVKDGSYDREITLIDPVVKQDGTVDLSADFDKQRISGYLNSDTLGQIRLIETDLHARHFQGQTLEKEGLSKSFYSGNISSNGSDVVGGVYDVKFENVNGKSGNYHAIFGGTKQ